LNPDQAAEMLQVEERGIDLLKRVNEDEKLAKAIQQVQSQASILEMWRSSMALTGTRKTSSVGLQENSGPSTSGSARLNVVGSEAE
jgi:hypothetical protein